MGKEQRFRPGEMIAQSGLYTAYHLAEHRGPHDMALLAAKLFPKCNICGDQVWYELVHAAPYIFDDVDFRPADPDLHEERAVTPQPRKPRG